MTETSRVQIGHLIKILEVLYNAYKEEKELVVSDLIIGSRLNTTTVYNVRRRLKQDGFIEERYNPDRTVTIKLTPKGVELAKCILKCKDLLLK